MSRPRAIAIFGGSFDPPHVAHVLAVAYVVSTANVDEVRVVPTFQHPFAKPLSPFDHRVAMCERAFEWMAGVVVDPIERELGGESRTLRTVEALRERHADATFRLIMGADLLAESHKWFAFDEITALAPPIVLGRHGVDAPDAPPAILPDVSSTHVREAIRDEHWGELEAIVPRGVLAYIREHRLFSGA